MVKSGRKICTVVLICEEHRGAFDSTTRDWPRVVPLRMTAFF